LVHSPEDVLAVAAINSGIGLISSIISFWAASRAVPLLPMHFDIKGACEQIKAGASTFLTTGGINLYTQSNAVLIGMIAGPLQVGLYLGADKIHWASLGLISQVTRAVYPRINNLLVSNPKESHRLMKLTLIMQGAFGLFLSVTMYLTAGIVTRVFLGNQYIDAIPIIRWFSAVPLLVGISNAIGINMMFPFRMTTEVARITLASGVFNVVMLSLLTYIDGAVGATISVVMTQALVTLAMGWTVYTKRKIVFKIQDV
jgi:polysaccharide transporter, PST family